MQDNNNIFLIIRVNCVSVFIFYIKITFILFTNFTKHFWFSKNVGHTIYNVTKWIASDFFAWTVLIHNDNVVLPEYAVQNSTFVWEWVHSLSTCKCSAWVVCGAFAGMGLRWWWWWWLRYRVVWSVREEHDETRFVGRGNHSYSCTTRTEIWVTHSGGGGDNVGVMGWVWVMGRGDGAGDNVGIGDGWGCYLNLSYINLSYIATTNKQF